MKHTLGFFLFVFLLGACQAEAPKNEESLDNNSTIDTTANLVEEVIDSIPFDSSNYQFSEGAILLDWKLLSKVEFDEVYNEEVQAYIPYPKFDSTILAIDGKEVIIEGFIIPVEETGEQSIVVLSANPFSSCFFCGGAGPESVMDIKLKESRRMEQDDIVQFRGKLKLNDTDLYYLNYILEEAELL